MDDYLDNTRNPGSTEEIDWFSRVGPVQQDPWVEKMQNLHPMFANYILSSQLLKQLKSDKIFCGTQFESKFRFGMQAHLSSLNPLATSLGYAVLDDNFSKLDKEKIKTIKNLLSGGGACRSDKDCRNIKCDSSCVSYSCKKCKNIKSLTDCRNSKCSYPLVDIGSVVRYAKLWLRVFKGSPKPVTPSIDFDIDDDKSDDFGDEYGDGDDFGGQYDDFGDEYGDADDFGDEYGDEYDDTDDFGAF